MRMKCFALQRHSRFLLERGRAAALFSSQQRGILSYGGRSPAGAARTKTPTPLIVGGTLGKMRTDTEIATRANARAGRAAEEENVNYSRSSSEPKIKWLHQAGDQGVDEAFEDPPPNRSDRTRSSASTSTEDGEDHGTASSATEVRHHLKSHRRVVRSPHLYSAVEVARSVWILRREGEQDRDQATPATSASASSTSSSSTNISIWPWVTFFLALQKHGGSVAADVVGLAEELLASEEYHRGVAQLAAHKTTQDEDAKEVFVFGPLGVGRGRDEKNGSDRNASPALQGGRKSKRGNSKCTPAVGRRTSIRTASIDVRPAVHAALTAVSCCAGDRFWDFYRRFDHDEAVYTTPTPFNIALAFVKTSRNCSDKHAAASGIFAEMRNRGVPPDDYTWNTLLACCKPLRHSGFYHPEEDELHGKEAEFAAGLPPPRELFESILEKSAVSYVGVVRACRFCPKLALKYGYNMLQTPGVFSVHAATLLLTSLKLAKQPFLAFTLHAEVARRTAAGAARGPHLLDKTYYLELVDAVGVRLFTTRMPSCKRQHTSGAPLVEFHDAFVTINHQEQDQGDSDTKSHSVPGATATSPRSSPSYPRFRAPALLSAGWRTAEVVAIDDHEDPPKSVFPNPMTKIQAKLLLHAFRSAANDIRSHPEVVHRFLAKMLNMNSSRLAKTSSSSPAAREVYLAYRGSSKGQALAAWKDVSWHKEVEAISKKHGLRGHEERRT